MPKISWQTIRFLIVGGSGALVYMVASFAFITYISIPAYIASVIAYAISFIFAYLGQKIWAFQSKAPHHRTLSRYLLLQIFCASFAATFTQAAINEGSLSVIGISILASVLTALVSYFASSKWVFTDTIPQEPILQSGKFKTFNSRFVFRQNNYYKNLSVCFFLIFLLMFFT